MPKKVYVNRYGHEGGPRERVKTRIIKDFDEMPKHRKVVIDEECCGEHRHHERKHRHHESKLRHHEREHRHHEMKHKRHERKHRHVHVHPRFERKQKTKMFTNKEDLVKYVNEVGELGHNIDIFKIEEDLYKVVVVEVVEVKAEVEIEVEEEATPDEEIEVEVEIEEE